MLSVPSGATRCYLRRVDPLLSELAAIVAEAEHAGIGVLVIGACALRTYLLRPEARATVDLDLLIAAAGRAGMEDILRRRGFQIYAMGPWLRAERPLGTPRIVDVAIDAIVDLASFEKYPLRPADGQRRREAGGPELPVPALEDLVAQKLIACREKDVLDVLLVALGPGLDPTRLADGIEARDVEIPVRRGLLELFASARSGRLAQLWAERTGETLAPDELNRGVRSLQAWFGVSA